MDFLIADYKSEVAENDASVAVANFNKLTESLVKGTDMKCSFVFNLKNMVSLRVLFSAVWISLMILYHLFLVSLLVIGNNKDVYKRQEPHPAGHHHDLGPPPRHRAAGR